MKIKKFIQKWLINNLGYKIFVIVLAFALWLVIVNVQDPDYTKTVAGISVTIINEDKITDNDYVYVVESGDTATIRITGPRSIVNKLTSDDFVATADFSQLSLTNAVPITVELSEGTNLYSNRVEITQQTVSMVLSLEEVVTESFPVDVTYTGTKDDDMYIEGYTLSDEKIKVTAPKSIIEEIAFAEINVDYSDIVEGEKLSRKPILYDAARKQIKNTKDISKDVKKITIEFDLEFSTTVAVVFEPKESVASGYEIVDITYTPETIKVKGESSAISELTAIIIPSDAIDIAGATSNVRTTLYLSDYLPDGLALASGTSYVTVTVWVSANEEGS